MSVSVVFEKMDREESRAVIKHFSLKYWMATLIKAELDEVHGKSAPSLKAEPQLTMERTPGAYFIKVTSLQVTSL